MTMVDRPDTMVDLPDTLVDLPYTMVLFLVLKKVLWLKQVLF